MSLMSLLAFGENIHPSSIASCIVGFERLKLHISIKDFHPFQTVWYAGSSDSSNMAIVSLCNDWLNLHHDVLGIKPDATYKNLMDNWDTDPGMIMAAITTIHLTLKADCPDSLRLTNDDVQKVIWYALDENFGNVLFELEQKKVIQLTNKGREEIPNYVPTHGRRYWREKLGHDVWIDPTTETPYSCPECSKSLQLKAINFLAYHTEEQRKLGGDHLLFL